MRSTLLAMAKEAHRAGRVAAAEDLYKQVCDQVPADAAEAHQWWAFKYDSELNGIGVHADFAAVNVNSWITPDEANLDKEHGGLLIRNKPAPLDWKFEKYNNVETGEIRTFLLDAHAPSVTVPYRANRAVIFNFDPFHETDRIAFREGYQNRRIHITLLYGLREHAAAGDPGRGLRPAVPEVAATPPRSSSDR